MPFPEACLRGIKDEALLVSVTNHQVLAGAFVFDGQKQDGTLAQSINWMDDDDAVAHTLLQTGREGRVRFRGGAAQLTRAALDNVAKMPMVRDLLTYERDRLADNPYHGNILLARDTSKPLRQNIQSALALAVQKVHPQP